MKRRAFLDTPVFIYAHEYPSSNSAIIISLLNKDEIEGIVSEQVVKEVLRYFEKYYGIKLARIFRRYLLEACLFIPRIEVLPEMEKYKGQIKEKDLEQLAVTKKLGIKYLISYDRDFEPFEEYCPPRKFLQLLQLPGTETPY